MWWAKTEACSGRRVEPQAITWYVVPDVSVFATAHEQNVGFWSRGTDGARIVIAGNYIGDEMVVRHEMLHALLDRGDHPPEYFVTRCRLTWASWGGEASPSGLAPNSFDRAIRPSRRPG